MSGATSANRSRGGRSAGWPAQAPGRGRFAGIPHAPLRRFSLDGLPARPPGSRARRALPAGAERRRRPRFPRGRRSDVSCGLPRRRDIADAIAGLVTGTAARQARRRACPRREAAPAGPLPAGLLLEGLVTRERAERPSPLRPGSGSSRASAASALRSDLRASRPARACTGPRFARSSWPGSSVPRPSGALWEGAGSACRAGAKLWRLRASEGRSRRPSPR